MRLRTQNARRSNRLRFATCLEGKVGPKVLRRVSAVRSPAPGYSTGTRRAAVAAQLLESVPHTKVSRHESVRVAQRPHRDVADRPRADSRKREQAMLDLISRH